MQEEELEEDDDNKTTERKSVAHGSKRKTSERVYTQDYDDENAADVEDMDRVDDDEDDEHSGSVVRK